MQLYKILAVKNSEKYLILSLEDRDGKVIEKSWKGGDIHQLYLQDDQLYQHVLSHGLVGMFVGIEVVSSGRMNWERVEALLLGPVAWRKEDEPSS